MKIYIASDHAGVKEKDIIIEHLKKTAGNVICDYGPSKDDGPVDYPYYAFKVGQEINNNNDEVNHPIGILICGTGIGMDMVVNKFDQVRAARCLDTEDAELSRQHNNANVLCLSTRKGLEYLELTNIIDTFIKTKFSDEERHYRRVDMIYCLDYCI